MTNELVPDLEICREAVKSGLVMESEYYWFIGLKDTDYWFDDDTPSYDTPKIINEIRNKLLGESYPAPLTDEILEKLPQQLNGKDLKMVKLPFDMYSCGYPRDEKGHGLNYVKDKKLSNALLLLAIKLKEENII